MACVVITQRGWLSKIADSMDEEIHHKTTKGQKTQKYPFLNASFVFLWVLW
jgi:hypothetical protein